jgi:hypothetical protein
MACFLHDPQEAARMTEQWKHVRIEKDGKSCTGKYRVEGGIMTVTYDAEGSGDKSRRVENSEHERLAKRLLIELVSELGTKNSR